MQTTYSTDASQSEESQLAWVVQAIAPDPGTVVLFGAKFFGRQCVEGDVAGPVVKGIRRAFAKERVVVLVDEFNTTKCHLQCGGTLSTHREDARKKWRQCV
jgi:hypothetical protein